MQFGDPVVVLLTLATIGFIGLVLILIVTPILLQLGVTLEAFSVLGEGLGEYFGRPGLFRACCLISMLGVAACCVGAVLLIITGIGCFTDNPSSICRLIGR